MNMNIPAQEIVYVLLEKLKANGTFDEFRRFCVSDIDAKSAFQNWKQRIESSALKFLSQVEYTPELNKNMIWEKMRKHLLDGHETQDISDGADRILNQLLGPRTLDAVEPKIQKIVNEYLGNENGTVTTEVNGLNEITTSLKRVSENPSFPSFKPKIDLISDVENMENIDEISPEFEPLTRNNYNSDDDSVSGMSDLLSIGSPEKIVFKESNDTSNFVELETNKNIVEDTQQSLSDKNGMIHQKDKSTNNESKNTNIISNNAEKLKTNDLKSKSKHHSSSASGHTSSQDKSSSHRSKNRNSNSHRSTSREENDIKKKNDSNSKDKKNDHSKHHNNSKDKDKKNKHKKSHHTDRDKTPKRDRKDSRSDKKEKSSSLCKEPKLLSGNRSDDESNAGGSSRQKSSISKNKSSTSEKSKSSSSNHKTSRKDNSKDVVNKSKDKSSLSSSSFNLGSCEINNKNKKRPVVKEKINNPNKKIKLTNDQDSSVLYDEKSEANVLLSISLTSFNTPDNEMKRANIDSSSVDKTLNTDDAENNTEIKEECVNQILSNSVDSTKNTNLIKANLESSLPLNSIDNVSIINETKANHLCNEGCGVKNVFLSSKDEQLEKNYIETNKIHSKQTKDDNNIECVLNNKEMQTSMANINSNSNQITSKHNSNTKSTIPNAKLLPTQIDAPKKKRNSIKTVTKTNKKTKSLLFSGHFDISLKDNTSKTVSLKPNGKPSTCEVEIKINDPLDQDNQNKNTESLNVDASTGGFKGFSFAKHCKNHQILMSCIKTLENKISQENVVNGGFKGFSVTTAVPCKHRQSVYLQFIKETKAKLCFEGFRKEDLRRCIGYEHVKSQLEVLKIENNKQKTIVNGENGIQSQTTLNNVMALIQENKEDNNATQNENCSQPNNSTKNECPVVINNNHDITPSAHWVVEQEMKYKLLPVKVKLERLMEYRCPRYTKRVTHSTKVPSITQKEKID